MVAATLDGVSWNLLPLDSMSSFPLWTFSPMASSPHSLESQASYPSWVLMTEPPLALPHYSTWNTAMGGVSNSTNLLRTTYLLLEKIINNSFFFLLNTQKYSFFLAL